jgi:RHS repeat-associated protein
MEKRRSGRGVVGPLASLLLVVLTGCGDGKHGQSSGPTPAGTAETDCSDGQDNDGDGFKDCDDADCRLSSKSCELAPALDRSVATTVWESAQFLFTGKDPVQQGTSAKKFSRKRIALLHGKAIDHAGEPLGGVRVAIASHPEWGYTSTRPDGAFDMAVEGGSQLLVQFSRDGYLSSERGVQVAWQSYEALPEVGLIEAGKTSTPITANADHEQVAEGDVVEDDFGRRQPVVVFVKETTATARLADGSTEPLKDLHVRLTEYPFEPRNDETLDEPSRFLPGTAPRTGSLSWGVEATIDEAQELGATTVEFSTPASILLENFLRLPVGSPIPLGYYERGKGHWQGEDAGHVIKLLSVTDGEADVDTDGDGKAEDVDTLTKQHILHGVRRELARRYEPGATLWHIPVEHFSPQSADFAAAAPITAEAPTAGAVTLRPVDDFTRRGGLVVERQALGQAFSLGLAGTPFQLNYQSDRSAQYRKGFQIDFPAVGDTVPDGLKKIVIKARIAGQVLTQSFDPKPKKHAVLDWDGKDSLGRFVQGQQRARVSLSYIYDGELRPAESFGSTSKVKITSSTADDGTVSVDAALTKRFSVTVGAWDSSGYQLGGLGLDVLHAFDPGTGKIYFGSGDERSAENVALVTTRPAGDASLGTPDGVFAAPDGSIIVTEDAEVRGSGAIVRVAPDGQVSPLAGDGALGDAADLVVGSPQGIAFKSDGSIIFSDFTFGAIREIAPDGSFRTLVGRADDDQQTPEIEASLDGLDAIALGLRGELYLINGNQIQKLEGGALTPFAGTGDLPTGNDVLETEGAPATTVALNVPSGIAVGPDGSVFISERDGARVRVVATDGTMRTFAGTGIPGFSGDGQRAVAAQLHGPRGIALDRDGTLYVADQVFAAGSKGAPNSRIRRVTTDGIITTVAGGGDAKLADGQRPTQIKLDKPDGIAIGAGGELFIATSTTVYKVAPGLTEISSDNSLVPSKDGHTLYSFDARGKHLATINAVTGVTELSFGYDDAGRLITITDKNQLITTIQRDEDGVPGTIVGPFGQRTNLEIIDGELKSITDPLDRVVHIEYQDGLLSKVVSPLGAEKTFEYSKDGLGLLESAKDPSGYFERFEKFEPKSTKPGSVNVGLRVVTPSGAPTDYETTFDGDTIRRSVKEADGSQAESLDQIAVIPENYADGSRGLLNLDPDTGFGPQVLLPKDHTLTTPGGRVLETTFNETKRFDDPQNLLSATHWSTTVQDIQGRGTTVDFDRKDRTIRAQTALGRVTTTVLDKLGRKTDADAPGFGSTHFDYDDKGRIVGITRSAGKETRSQTYNYDDSDGFLRQVTDALNQTTKYEPDIVGRLLGVTDPSGATVAQQFDVDDKLTLVTLPDNKPHQFKYADKGLSSLLELTTPPDVGIAGKFKLGAGGVRYAFNDNNLPTLIERSDGETVAFDYDTALRLQTLTTSGVALTYEYDNAGRVSTVHRTDGPSVALGFDGPLLTSTEWTGPVKGKLTADYDENFRLSQLTVNDASTVSFAYDDDGAVISASGNQQTLALTRDPQTGFVTDTALGKVTTTQAFNGFGELAQLDATFQGKANFSQALQRDELGRITQLDETIGNTQNTTLYTYDAAGRLETVTRGLDVTTYQYDDNGNRTAVLLNGNETAAATYDAQDRIISHGDISFEQTNNGELLRRTQGSSALELTYDGLGNLLTAVSTNAKATKTIDYTVDGFNRRVGKQVGGKFSRAWLYRDDLRPVAEITDGGVFSHFVYAGDAPGAPDFMLRVGVPFRFVKDHLGSVRLVVNATTGVVAQRLDYDEFGNVAADSAPGFQPFGYAGGLYDADTGLVRFGARDYDPAVGRWASKDPIGFRAQGTNFYAYGLGDPINTVDRRGLDVCRASSNEGYHHEWIQIGSDTKRTYGFWPTTNPFGGPSTIISPDWKAEDEPRELVCYKSTPAEDLAVEKWIKKQYAVNRSNPSVPYFFGTQDCRHFTDRVIQELARIQKRSAPWQLRFNFLPEWVLLFF